MSGTPGVDTSPRVPRQVTAQAQRAQAMLDAQRGEPAEVTPPAAPVATPPAQPVATPTPSASPRSADPALGDPRENDPAYWKQRFNVTQGMLRREREEGENEIRELKARLTALQNEVAGLKAKAPVADAEIKLEEWFTAEQIEEMGEDRCREQVRISLLAAKREANSAVAAHVAPLQQQRDDEQKADRKKAVRAMVARMTEAVPSWQEINVTDGWLEFLQQRDDRTGMTRQQIIDHADAQADAEPIIELLRQHIATLNPAQVDPTPPVVPSGTGATGAPGAPPAPSDETPLTRAEVKRLYTRIAIDRNLTDQQRVEKRTALDARVKAAQAAGTLR